MDKYNPPKKEEMNSQDESYTSGLENNQCKLEQVKRLWEIYSVNNTDQIPNESEYIEIFSTGGEFRYVSDKCSET